MYTLVIIDDEEKIVEGIAHLFPWEEIGFQVVQSFTNAALALDYIINFQYFKPPKTPINSGKFKI